VKWYFLPVLALFAVVSVEEASAMPWALIGVKTLNISVASGCGLGVRRGPFDSCAPVYAAAPGFYRSYRNNYYVGPGRGNFCGWRAARVACSFDGICWVACN
jgi:hypothetical protein